MTAARARQPPRSPVELLAAHNPQALALAELASLAARVEPELLRALRLELVAGADSSAEADLWWNPAVEIRGATAITFSAEAQRVLRARLLADPARAAAAYHMTRRMHRGTALLLRLEELVTWLALRRPSAVAAIDRLLRPAALTMLTDASRRATIAVWASRMLPRLPEAARRTRSFWLLLFGANAHPRGEPVVIEASAAVPIGEMPAEIFTGVGDAFLEVERRGDRLALRRAAATGARTLACPAIEPIVVEVASAVETTATMVGKAWTEVPVSGPTARVRALDGREYEVRVASAVTQPVVKADEDVWAACARIRGVHAPVHATGYLIEPTLVVTSVRDWEVEVIVEFGAVQRRGLLAREDSDAATAVYRLDTPVLGVTPLQIADAPRESRSYHTFTCKIDANQGEEFRGVLHPIGPSESRLIVNVEVRNAEGLELTGAPIIVDGKVVGHLVERLERDYDWLGVPGERVQRVIDQVIRTRAFLEQCAAEEGASYGPEDVTGLREDERPAAGELLALFETGRPGARAAALALLPHVHQWPVRDALRVLYDPIERRRSELEQRLALGIAGDLLEQGVSSEQSDLVDLRDALRAARRGPAPTIDASAPQLYAQANRIEALLAQRLDRPALGETAPWDTSGLLDPGAPGIYASEAHERVAQEIASSSITLISGGTAHGRALVIRRWLAMSADRSRPLLAWSFEGPESSLDAFTNAGGRLLGCAPELEAVADAMKRRNADLVLEGVDRLESGLQGAVLRLAVVLGARQGKRSRRVVLASAQPFQMTVSPRLVDLSDMRRDPAFVAALALEGSVNAALVNRIAAFDVDVPVTMAYAAASSADPNPGFLLYAVRGWLNAPFAFSAQTAHRALRTTFGATDMSQAAASHAVKAVECVAAQHDPAIAVVSAVEHAIRITNDRSRVHAAIIEALLGRKFPSDQPAEPAPAWLLRLDGPLPQTEQIAGRDLLRQAAHDTELEAFPDPDEPATLVLGARPGAIQILLDMYRASHLNRIKSRSVLWISERSPAPRAGDTYKGKFGGLPERDGRRVSARVEPSDGAHHVVQVEVVPTDPARPLRGEVMLFVHESSGVAHRAVPVVEGRATASVIAWRAFTLGVETDSGRVRLELDLANVPGATHEFIHVTSPGQARAPSRKDT